MRIHKDDEKDTQSIWTEAQDAKTEQRPRVLARFLWEGNPTTKKNSQIIRSGRNGKPYIAQGAKYEAYAAAASWQMKWHEDPIRVPVTVTVLFYRDSKRAVDLTNLLEAVDDILEDCGVIANDCRDIIASHDGSRVYLDRDRPRTEITITEFDETYEVWSDKFRTGEGD